MLGPDHVHRDHHRRHPDKRHVRHRCVIRSPPFGSGGTLGTDAPGSEVLYTLGPHHVLGWLPLPCRAAITTLDGCKAAAVAAGARVLSATSVANASLPSGYPHPTSAQDPQGPSRTVQCLGACWFPLSHSRSRVPT